MLAGNAVGDIFEKRVNAAREGCAEILDACVEDFRRRVLTEPERLTLLGCRPVGQFLDAVLDAECAFAARDFATPPAAKPPHGVAAMTQQVADGAVRKGAMHAVN